MKPIIDPMLFYWIDVLVGVKTMLVVFGVGALLVTVLTIGIASACGDLDWGYDDDIKKIKFAFKIVCVSIALLSVNIFIPSETTMYKILIAKNITPDNIEIVQGEITDLIDYIIEKIDQLND